MPNDEAHEGITKSLEWIKESGLLAVTVLGLILYFILSIPATLFYSQLGTTTGEVGINYVNLLSSSTFELLVIFAVLAGTIFVGGFIIAYFLIFAYTITPSLESLRPAAWKRTRQERMTWAFKNNLRLY